MKKILVPTLMVIVSTLLGLALIDAFFFPTLLTTLPLNKATFVDPPLRVLAQSSKDGLIPRQDYIAVFGDSYAQGNGDWIKSVDPESRDPYQATHIIHQLLGRDVVYLAKGGAGSLTGLSGYPVRFIDYLQKMYLYDIPTPGTVIIYFYAGNDVEDNLSRLKKFYTDKGYDPEKVRDPEYYQRFLDEFSEEFKTYNPVVNLPSALFIANVVKEKIAAGRDYFKESFQDKSAGTEHNLILLDGKPVEVDKSFQLYTPNYSDEQIDLALYMFDQGLTHMRRLFPDTRFLVAYIPSVAECYTYAGDAYNLDESGKGTLLAEAMPKVEKVRAEVTRLALAHRMAFTDLTVPLRRAASHELIHGPEDFTHPNKIGYTILGTELSQALVENGMAEYPK